MISITSEDDLEKVKKFADENRMNWLQIYNAPKKPFLLKHRMLFQTEGYMQSCTYLIGPDGKVLSIMSSPEEIISTCNEYFADSQISSGK